MNKKEKKKMFFVLFRSSDHFSLLNEINFFFSFEILFIIATEKKR
jgi:hypothetical protein